jgi:hypothetical protein
MLAASIIRAIALMMEAASTSETSVNFYQTTQRNNPEDSRLRKDTSGIHDCTFQCPSSFFLLVRSHGLGLFFCSG